MYILYNIYIYTFILYSHFTFSHASEEILALTMREVGVAVARDKKKDLYMNIASSEMQAQLQS